MNPTITRVTRTAFLLLFIVPVVTWFLVKPVRLIAPELLGVRNEIWLGRAISSNVWYFRYSYKSKSLEALLRTSRIDPSVASAGTWHSKVLGLAALVD